MAILYLNRYIMKLLVFFLLFYSCTQINSWRTHSYDTKITQDSLKLYAYKVFEIIDLKQYEDTLLIVSTTKVLFYPFGKYSNFKEFKDGYLLKYDLNISIDSTFNIFRIFSLGNKKTNIKLIENTETEKLELFNANIKDNSFELFYGIRIGMKKEDVLLKIFERIPSELNNIRTIKIVSGLEGVWYYFNFSKKELLENVIIESDYTLE